MAADLLMSAAQTETTVLDEKLYFNVFNLPTQMRRAVLRGLADGRPTRSVPLP